MNTIPQKMPGMVNVRGYTPKGARHNLSFDERTPLVKVLQTLLDHLCTLCVMDSGRTYTYDGRLWRSAGTVTAECRAKVGVGQGVTITIAACDEVPEPGPAAITGDNDGDVG